jgi:PEGA domain
LDFASRPLRAALSLSFCLFAAQSARAQTATPAATTPPPSAAEAPTSDAPATGSAPVASADGQATAPAPGVPSEEVQASPEVLENAKRHFRQGVAFASAGNCGGAIVEFEAAYNLIPRPNALYNIAQCQERLFRYDLAISYYERYLKEAPADAADRPAVEAALKTLGNLLGVLHIKCNVKAEVWIDDRLGGSAPGDVYVPAGGHSLEVRAEGYMPKKTEVRLVGREEVTLSIELEKAQTTVNVTETTGITPTLFWIGASATVISAGIGGAFALQVGSLYDDAKQTPAVSPSRVTQKKDIESAELTADIFFLTAGVLAIGTTIIAFMTEWDEPASSHTPATDTQARVQLTPAMAPGYAGLSLRGGL